MRAGLLLAIALIGGPAYAGETQIAAAKAALERTLVDPESAQYRDIRDVPGVGVCGQYNARNSYGGYVGFSGFAWVEATGEIVTDSPYIERTVNRPLERAKVFAKMGCPTHLEIYLEIERRRLADSGK